jgi:hypothetical protein
MEAVDDCCCSPLKVFALNVGVDMGKVGNVDVDAGGAGNGSAISTSLSSPLTTSELLEHIFDDDSNSSIPSFSFPCSPFIPSVPFSSSNPCPLSMPTIHTRTHTDLHITLIFTLCPQSRADAQRPPKSAAQPRPASPLSPSVLAQPHIQAAPTKVKLCLCDFVLRKKQFEEMENELSKSVQASGCK